MSSATLFFAPQARFFTPQITSMGGAKLQFYLSASSTPAEVFADAGLSVSLGSLVEADTNGQFVPIYLTSATTYRIVLLDSSNVVQSDIDPYLPSRDYAPGTVISWFGAAINLETYYPSALWQICDGTNLSPDMGGRVPIGVGGGFAIGNSGGAATANFTTATDGEHQHTSVTSGAHTLTVDEMPAHTHSINSTFTAGTVPNGSPQQFANHFDTNTGSTGGDQPHTHPNGVAAVTDSAHAHNGSVDVMQPYRALYMLMRRY